MNDRVVDISIVIPVYNSEKSLPNLFQRLAECARNIDRTFELILIDDGSRDRSWNVLEKESKTCAIPVVAIRLMRNFGQHNAIMCGFRHAKGTYVVTMDDDLQNPPEEIERLLSHIEEHDLDLVYGSFDVGSGKKHSSWRNMGTRLVGVFFRSVFDVNVQTTSFRIIRKELVDAVLSYSLNFTYIDGLLAWNTQRVGEVAVEHHPRTEGSSGYSVGKLLLLALNLFTNFSILPLQIVSILGMTFAAAGLVIGVYFVGQYMFGNIAIPGFASTIISLLILGGVQMLSLGIIGEYVGRLHLNMNRKPQYVERTVQSTPTGADMPAGDAVMRS